MIEMNKELGATWEKQLNDYINDNHLLCYTLPIPGIYAITIDSHIAYINASTDTFRTGKNIIWDIFVRKQLQHYVVDQKILKSIKLWQKQI